MGRLLEARGLRELSEIPTILSTNVSAYQSDLYWGKKRLLTSMRVYLVCRSNFLMVVPRKFVM
jgi:hypothetical protein